MSIPSLPLRPPYRQHIGLSFGRAANTYENAASVQREVAEQLLNLLCPWVRLDPSNPSSAAPTADWQVLDAGCGTGLGARPLRSLHPQTQLTGVDLAQPMLEKARPNLDAACLADIAALPFANARFDAWWSNLALQWCDPNAVLREAARVLRPAGLLAFSTLGPGTFRELHQAMEALSPPAMVFQDWSQLSTALHQAHLHVLTQCHRSVVTFHPDLKSLLRDLRAVGANVGGRTDHPKARNLGGRQAWQTVQHAYECQRQDQGLPLSYEVYWVIAQHHPQPESQ